MTEQHRGPGPEHRADSAGQPWAGRHLKPNPFSGDDGAIQPAMAAALALESRPQRVVAVVAALRETRVLAPIVAHEHPGTDEHGNPKPHAADTFRLGDRSGDAMASANLVSVRTPDGRSAVPVFSSVDALQAWDATARPVPVEGARAALAAVQESDSLLVLDPGNELTVLVPRPAVWAIARQQPWTPSWEDPEVTHAATQALRGLTELVGLRTEPGDRSELRIRLAVRADVTPERLREVLNAASQALSNDALIRERSDSLELAPQVMAG
ncbi:SseB family protein [Bogoriella caseilytica]|uniref:Type III secretion system (T3SS) SseB-like protein n=1 Tax=Bogoriella caseilytica TaxID=56055 RepID=A0A3N2BG46_9MICO|nr:SseB family protein [Bogoriella caseilytica]ROR74195.1 type III secretion system (T3SS) SseB-like protein [Bogoriella caseilytica]